MEDDLIRLEEKLNRFVEVFQHLRAENLQLRQTLASKSSENKHLTEKLEDVTRRVESLLAELPE
jgi:cell division protein ZapB